MDSIEASTAPCSGIIAGGLAVAVRCSSSADSAFDGDGDDDDDDDDDGRGYVPLRWPGRIWLLTF
jgi:hypothetical protein